MNSAQTINRITSEDDDLGQASVRELIVLLALAEDEHRNTANPRRIAALIRREQAIVMALHRNGLTATGPDNPQLPGQSTPPPVENLVVK
ncbi:hypothetical protein AOC05_08610 [Arthrobacter alpinus]|uniref:Uncharacterized protein n=1 Tax=Arthrobacter alpinus TaxID=656366 RepID=A0A0M3UG28_9MICC|nr:hypothetical protein AOC05_08610 [Arthrobacter alpinus]